MKNFYLSKGIYIKQFLNSNSVEIDFSIENNRCTDPDVEEYISNKIKNIKKDKEIFNKPKFRLNEIQINNETIFIQIGLTTYFEYLVTNHDENAYRKLTNFADKKGLCLDSFLSNAIGNLAILETSNNKIILLKRSNSVSTFNDFWDAPGGHPEPNNIIKFLDSKNVSSYVKFELYNSIINEINQELGIPKDFLYPIFFMGIILDRNNGMKPEMIFYKRLLITDEDVKNYYKNAVDKNESSELFFLNWKNKILRNIFQKKELLTYPTKLSMSILLNYLKNNNI